MWALSSVGVSILMVFAEASARKGISYAQRTDARGLVTEYTYDAFGEVRMQSGTLSTDFLFTGEQLGAEARLTQGLYYRRGLNMSQVMAASCLSPPR
jgi:hypothetical protein